jgi:hypothetical protein
MPPSRGRERRKDEKGKKGISKGKENRKRIENPKNREIISLITN